MGVADIYCSKCGLPIRKIDQRDKNIIPTEIQNILSNAIFMLDDNNYRINEHNVEKKYKDKFIIELLYSEDHTTDLYHVKCKDNAFLTSNKDFVQGMFQDQFFKDERYLEFYKDPKQFKKKNIVFYPSLSRHKLKSDQYIDKEKSCPPDKVLNPDTMRYVKSTGPIGRRILENRLS